MTPKSTFALVPGAAQIAAFPPVPQARRIKPGDEGLPLRSNFVWVLSGNVVFAICQWGMIIALAKLGDSVMLGQFSLGLAIATPVLTLANLNLRAVLATDSTLSYCFREYRSLRFVTTAAALAVIVVLVHLGGYRHQTAIVILAVALVKAIDTLSDIHYGLFQQHDRLDETGISMMIRGVLSVAVLTAVLYVTKDVFWGCLTVALAWLLALLVCDSRNARRLEARVGSSTAALAGPARATSERASSAATRRWRLIRISFPLGLVTTLAAINLNIPRYFIHARMGENQLGIFSAMAYATVAITLVSDSLGHAGSPRMSRLYAEGRLAEFREILLRLFTVCSALGLAAIAIAEFAGKRLLTLLYSGEYAKHSRVFTLLILATAINCVASIFTSGITSARCFGIQVPLFALAAASSVLFCMRWVPGTGLAAGAGAMACSAVVRLVLSALVIRHLLSERSKSLTNSGVRSAL